MLCLRKIVHKKTLYRKVKDHYYYTGKYRGPVQSTFNLKLNVPNEIPVVFHNGLKYDYHFITKELANEFQGPCDCIEENSEIYKFFSVPIKKEIIKKLIRKAIKLLKQYHTK